ncbi:hypothetical protein FHE66_08190 [Georgenia sp. 311]|uniref:Uncharacterized protein n=1 Tax=Georgenia wutianyii TaxID=2585135 RepID=A0ABX5VMQ8_9MICO|nr:MULTISPECIES: hypothetical protein [Georgenia]QDB79797.1 hypothetical protein FE251_10730 [Georgenia wutianyii]TNC18121.1 hypothetical protein FHE66_08190 [Georgenia sp. 311]
MNEVPAVAVVLTPVASASALAGLCAMQDVDVHVVPSRSGAVAVVDLEPATEPAAEQAAEPKDWDIAELLGTPGQEVPPAADQAARTLSRLTKAGVVLITSALTTDSGVEHGLSGQLTARRYERGEPGEDVPVGLVLAGADDVVEDLVLGRVRAADVPGHQRSGDLPRWKAARMFAKGLRKPRP